MLPQMPYGDSVFFVMLFRSYLHSSATKRTAISNREIESQASLPSSTIAAFLRRHTRCPPPSPTVPPLPQSKDGGVKLWDTKKAKLVYQWPKLPNRHTFLQSSSRGVHLSI
ncbi:hypothetical protein LXL04_006474 [Taraxacum kok-saghyz]